MNFTSHYDAPVRLTALLVNALTGGEERGRPRPRPKGDARREAATDAVRSIDPGLRTLSREEADRLTAYAERLRGVFLAVADEDLDAAAAAVDELLRETNTQPYMARHDEQSWHVHHRGTAGGPAAEWAGTCAAALAVVLGSEARGRLGICTADRCDQVYVDTSHNGTRRFCSTTCQNRIKAAAFRARRLQ